MRTLKLLLLIVACCSLAAAQGQATVVGGYASNWVLPAAGTVPFVPLLKTPEISLDQPVLTIGASNATLGLTAGATSSTLSLQEEENVPMLTNEKPMSGEPEMFNTGVATSQDSIGVAVLLGQTSLHAPGAHAYTNDDISRLDQQTGIVKFKGKTEEVR